VALEDDELYDEANLVSELRTFGQLIAAALRAAASTPEAKTLKLEFKAGVSAMQSEIRDSATSSKETTQRVTSQYRETGSTRVRTDLAAALRALNATMTNLADNLEPSGEVVDVDDAREVDSAAPQQAAPPIKGGEVEGAVGGGPVSEPPDSSS
jgi:hypothetical protein